MNSRYIKFIQKKILKSNLVDLDNLLEEGKNKNKASNQGQISYNFDFSKSNNTYIDTSNLPKRDSLPINTSINH